jgi:hypothetical protein
VVPKYLDERDQERMKKRGANNRSAAEEDTDDECPTIVVCSGELVEQVRTCFTFTPAAIGIDSLI